MATIRVDYENNAVEWWAAFWASVADERFCADNPALCELLQRLVHNDWVEVSDPLAGELLRFAAALPGWADEGAPDYAPHPLIVDVGGGEAA